MHARNVTFLKNSNQGRAWITFVALKVISGIERRGKARSLQQFMVEFTAIMLPKQLSFLPFLTLSHFQRLHFIEYTLVKRSHCHPINWPRKKKIIPVLNLSRCFDGCYTESWHPYWVICFDTSLTSFWDILIFSRMPLECMNRIISSSKSRMLVLCMLFLTMWVYSFLHVV